MYTAAAYDLLESDTQCSLIALPARTWTKRAHCTSSDAACGSFFAYDCTGAIFKKISGNLIIVEVNVMNIICEECNRY